MTVEELKPNSCLPSWAVINVETTGERTSWMHERQDTPRVPYRTVEGKAFIRGVEVATFDVHWTHGREHKGSVWVSVPDESWHVIFDWRKLKGGLKITGGEGHPFERIVVDAVLRKTFALQEVRDCVGIGDIYSEYVRELFEPDADAPPIHIDLPLLFIGHTWLPKLGRDQTRNTHWNRALGEALENAGYRVHRRKIYGARSKVHLALFAALAA